MSSSQYKIEFHKNAQKQLAELPRGMQKRVTKAVDALAANPRPPGCVAMQGTDAPAYRVRVGDYRVVYAIQDEVLTVLIVRIGHRREVYR